MKIIDSRSGKVMTPGKIVAYGGGEKLRVIDVKEGGLFSARALIERTHRDYSRTKPRASDQGSLRERDPIVTSQQWVSLDVRFMHPAYMFQRVAFIPS